MLDLVFWGMVSVSLSTGALVLLLSALRPALGRVISPRFFTALWALLALRLLLPFQIPMPKSAVLVHFDPPSRIVLSAADTEDPASPAPDSGELETLSPQQTTLPIGETAWEAELPQSQQSSGSAPQVSIPEEETLPQPDLWEQMERFLTGLSPAALLCAVWAAGAIFRLSFELTAAALYRRGLHRRTTLVLSSSLEELIATAAAELQLKRTPPVRCCDSLPSPMLIGFFRPVLLLPPAERYPREDWECVLRHELVHYRCHHMLYKLVFVLLCALQWWNPTAYLLRRQADRDLELTCDSLVLFGKPDGYRARYGRILLDSISPRHRFGDGCSSCFHRSSAAVLRRRLLNILGKSGRRGSPALLALALVFCLLASGFVSPEQVRNSSSPAAVHPATIHTISTAEELVAFAQGVNSGALNSDGGDWWVLTNDIDLTGVDWQPIGETPAMLSREHRFYYLDDDETFSLNGSDYYKPQRIYFDGQGHTVFGLSCFSEKEYRGFFFTVSSDSVIRNLNIEGSVTAPSCGGLIGIANGLIENCSFTGSVAGYEMVGGLIGMCEDAVVYNCRTNAEVSGSVSVGGMAGYGGAYNEGTYISCYASGSVSGVSAAQQQAATGLPNPPGDGWSDLASIGGFTGSGGKSYQNCIADAQMYCYYNSFYFGSFIGHYLNPIGDSCYYNQEINQHWTFGTIRLYLIDGQLAPEDVIVAPTTVRKETPGWTPVGITAEEIAQKLQEFDTGYQPMSIPLEQAQAVYQPQKMIPAETTDAAWFRCNYLDWVVDTGLLEVDFSSEDLSALGPTETRGSLTTSLYWALSRPEYLSLSRRGTLPRIFLESCLSSFLPCSPETVRALSSDCYDPQQESYYYDYTPPEQQTFVRVTGYQSSGTTLRLDYELYKLSEDAAAAWQAPVLFGTGRVLLSVPGGMAAENQDWTYLSNEFTAV
ncbi:MAG TPA: hypothetical protein H9896_03855 [Candidatus Pygmaiobacter gallistercoris]|nr:hypothetical protein [Candidatus Pygmaiobacter gallistercoris]